MREDVFVFNYTGKKHIVNVHSYLHKYHYHLQTHKPDFLKNLIILMVMGILLAYMLSKPEHGKHYHCKNAQLWSMIKPKGVSLMTLLSFYLRLIVILLKSVFCLWN